LPFTRAQILLELIDILGITIEINARVLMGIVEQPLGVDIIDPPVVVTVVIAQG
jgi:hypothetical protein